jgi:hypothetical protein
MLDYRTRRSGWKWQIQFALAESQFNPRSLTGSQQAAQGVTNRIHCSGFDVVEEGKRDSA